MPKRISLSKKSLGIPSKTKTKHFRSDIEIQSRFNFVDNNQQDYPVMVIPYTLDTKHLSEGWIECRPFESINYPGVFVDTEQWLFNWARDLALDITRWHGQSAFTSKLDLFFKPYKQNGDHYRSSDGVSLTMNRLIDIPCGFYRNRSRDGGYHRITEKQLADLEIFFHCAYTLLRLPYNAKGDKIMTQQDIGYNRRLGPIEGQNETFLPISFKRMTAVAVKSQQDDLTESDIVLEKQGNRFTLV